MSQTSFGASIGTRNESLYIKGPGHMIKMTVMAINSKRPIILKLGMKHQGDDLFKANINHDPVMTLTYFTARSTEVAHASKWGKLLKCHLKGKPEGNGQMG